MFIDLKFQVPTSPGAIHSQPSRIALAVTSRRRRLEVGVGVIVVIGRQVVERTRSGLVDESQLRRSVVRVLLLLDRLGFRQDSLLELAAG